MGSLSRKLGRLEQEAGGFYEVLTVKDGTTVKYEADEKLEALFALLDGRKHWLLPYFRAMDTSQGMPGLVRAIEGGVEDES